ncbi:MAG: hypothetical protein LQ348_006657 [Seirophora lacunosa]|nr:MAG: hypothetical protein LQ348_006657 [Seirophora lacunosa]
MAGQGWGKTKINTVNRYRNRGKYDYQTVNTIVDETPILHVSFAPSRTDDDDSPPFPVILPMVGCTSSYPDPALPDKSDSRILYLHGSATSRLIRLAPTSNDSDTPNSGIPVCVAATQLDGIVLALTPHHHSCNYRSAVVFGHAHLVTDPAERLHALQLVTNTLVPSRWENTRYPNATELQSTGVLRVEIASASAKIRTGSTGEDRGDLKDEGLRRSVWSGVVPAHIEFGEPVAAPTDLRGEVPGYLEGWIRGRNEEGERYAREAAVAFTK